MSGEGGRGISPEGLVILLRTALIDAVGDGKGSHRMIAAFDRAAADVMGRLLDGKPIPVIRRTHRARVNDAEEQATTEAR